MFCPLKHHSVGNEDASLGRISYFGNCDQENCAWWVDGHGTAKCAIKELALSNLAVAGRLMRKGD